MKRPNRYERLASRKLKRRIRLTGSVNPCPTSASREGAVRISVPRRSWDFGSCRKVMMYASSGEAILFVRKNP